MTINSPLVDGVLGNISEFAGDVSTLAELQTKLAVVDLKETAGRATYPVIMVVTALFLFLGTVPIALFGAAEVLVERNVFAHRSSAYLTVAGVAALVTFALVMVGLPGIKRSLGSMARSKDEFSRNIAWIKSVIASNGQAKH